MRDFALPLPMAVIGELVGVPAGDRSELQPHIRAAARGIEPMLGDEEVEASIAAITHLGAYFEHLLAERRRRPADDLLSALGQAHENDDRLTDDEVLSTAILLFAAGFETTTNLLGNGLLALLRHPDQLADWRAHPAIAQPRSTSSCASTAPSSSICAPRSKPASLAGAPLVRVIASSSSRVRPTAIRTASIAPTSWTCAAPTTPRSASAGASTTASAPHWPRWRGRSPSTRCSSAFPPLSSRWQSPRGARASPSVDCSTPAAPLRASRAAPHRPTGRPAGADRGSNAGSPPIVSSWPPGGGGAGASAAVACAAATRRAARSWPR